MSLGNMKIIAEIAEISSRIYGSIVDRDAARKEKERLQEERLKKLEKELEDLRSRKEKT